MTALLAYAFMRHALLAAGLVAVMAGPVGYFLVLRGQSFAGHAMSHAGFAGAAAALVLGAPPFGGFILASALAGAAIGAMDAQDGTRDVAIGVILALMLGSGMLLLGLAAAPGAQASLLLFGNVFAISDELLRGLALLAAAVLLGLGAIGRGLVLSSLSPALARSRGLAPRLFAVLFMALVGLCIAAASQIVGALLIFALSVAPGAAALRVARSIAGGIALAAALALLAAEGGILLAFATNTPPSFWIALIGTAIYLTSQIPLRRPAA